MRLLTALPILRTPGSRSPKTPEATHTATQQQLVGGMEVKETFFF